MLSSILCTTKVSVKTGDVLDLAALHGIVGKAGAWYDYKEEKIGQGREATKKYLKDNPKVLDEIEKEVREKVALTQKLSARKATSLGN